MTAARIVLAFVLVAANGFFVAVEFGLARLRPTQAVEFAHEGRPGAKSVQHAVEHIDSYLSACQLGITMCSLGLGALGEPAFHDALEPLLGDAAKVVGIGIASALAFAIITTLHVVVGELAPKSAAIARTPPIVLALTPPMRAFYMATKPLVDLFNGLGNLVLRPFGVPPASEAGHQPHSEDELRALLRESSREGTIGREEQQLSEAALVFGDLRAREVMRPRAEIAYVLTSDSPRRVAERVIETGHTRLPLCEASGGLDAAVGVINAKDLLPVGLAAEADVDLRSIARPIAHVDESARVDRLLRDMRRERRHLGLVHDEHGTVVGLVTLEDILEEIVGEIEDEFDPERAEAIRVEGDTVLIDGAAPAREVADRLGFELEGHHETTIGGYLSEELGRVPRPGEEVVLHERRFKVLAVDETLVTELALVDAPRDGAGDG
ncbi:MAG TPA: hemolysin family protein [Gaiellaceae bacterium]|nr:hemolysin family protein [Gaiellaceae bacterium]